MALHPSHSGCFSDVVGIVIVVVVVGMMSIIVCEGMLLFDYICISVDRLGLWPCAVRLDGLNVAVVCMV